MSTLAIILFAFGLTFVVVGAYGSALGSSTLEPRAGASEKQKRRTAASKADMRRLSPLLFKLGVVLCGAALLLAVIQLL